MPTMKRLLLMNISKKLWLLAACATAGIVIMTGLFLLSERSLIMEERQANVRQAVETAHGVLTYYHGLAAKGTLPEAEAKRQAMQAVKVLRYSGQEYFWINDMQPRMLMHPFKPELDGSDMSGNKDPNGLHLFVEFVKVVRASDAGFVFYMWPKPGSDTPVKKVSYVKGFAPWGWVIGSGVYLDSIQQTFITRLTWSLLGTLALAGVLLTICWAILVSGRMVATMSTTWNAACFRLRMPFWPVIMIIGMAPSSA